MTYTFGIYEKLFVKGILLREYAYFVDITYLKV